MGSHYSTRGIFYAAQNTDFYSALHKMSQPIPKLFLKVEKTQLISFSTSILSPIFLILCPLSLWFNPHIQCVFKKKSFISFVYICINFQYKVSCFVLFYSVWLEKRQTIVICFASPFFLLIKMLKNKSICISILFLLA